MFCCRVGFLEKLLDPSVWIITMIGSFLYSDDSAVGIDMFKKIVGSFKYLTITIVYSGFCNTLRMYCLSFSSLCSDMVPKTAPKSSTSHLKFLINDVYYGILKLLSILTRPSWWTILVQPPRLRPRPLLLDFDSLVLDVRMIVASLPIPPLLPPEGEAVSVSRVIVFNILNFPLQILLKLYSYSHYLREITPCICSLRTRQWYS